MRRRKNAVKSATVCADCFQPLATNASVTITRRKDRSVLWPCTGILPLADCPNLPDVLVI
jgi:hypothetical protein